MIRMNAVLTALGVTLALTFSFTASAAPGWIGDTIYVPMRSGPGSDYRIINKALKTGTPVEILDWEEDSDWVEIRVGGQEGYVGKQYVSRTPIASVQLEQRQKAFDEADTRVTEMREQVAAVTRERDQLAREKATLQANLKKSQQSLKRLQKAAAEPLKLEQQNQQLSGQVEQLSAELTSVKQENASLQGDRLYRGWRYALLTVFGGMAFGWLVKSQLGRRRSEWG